MFIYEGIMDQFPLAKFFLALLLEIFHLSSSWSNSQHQTEIGLRTHIVVSSDNHLIYVIQTVSLLGS